MRWALVVPVKRLATAKSRLVVDDAVRQELALAFALDTVSAAREAPSVELVVAVTDDPRAAAALRELGVDVEPDRPDGGLNPALRHGAEVVALAHPGLGVGALSADLPALRADELERALAAGAGAKAAMVSDRSGLGTTLLVARGLDAFVPRFGQRSRAAHRAAGVVEPDLGASVATLRTDVDTEVDLWDAVRLGIGIASAPLLADGSASSRAMTETVATVRGHDVVARTGTVLLDDGTLLAYDAAAFDAGGLRLLRPGQRVRIRLDVERGAILALTLSTFDLP